MKRSTTIATLFLAAFAAAGTVSAATPSADGVFSACKSKDGSIKLIDIDKGQSCNGQQQLVEWNQQGPQGPAGADGADGVSGYEVVFAHTALSSSADKTTWAFCPSGTQVIGGGAGVYGAIVGDAQVIIDGVGLVQDHPMNNSGWGARAAEFVATDDAWQLNVWAICAAVD